MEYFVPAVQGAFGLAGVAIGGVVLLFVVVWALLWMTFPVFVYLALGPIEKVLRQIEQNTRRQGD